MLPGMSGYDVCERVREPEKNARIDFERRTLTEDRTRSFNVGANQYLTKPFELDELISRVRNLLTSARAGTLPQSFERTNQIERISIWRCPNKFQHIQDQCG